MSAAELKELRKETKKYIDHADERLLKMVYAMFEADAENDKGSYQLTSEQEALLEERMRKYERGEMKFSTWDEVRARITAKGKNAA